VLNTGWLAAWFLAAIRRRASALFLVCRLSRCRVPYSNPVRTPVKAELVLHFGFPVAQEFSQIRSPHANEESP
jgi:hypothetical protein